MATLVLRWGADEAQSRALDLQQALANPRGVLTSIGAVVTAQARRAFEEQRFGDVVWPARYPRQKDPFLNIAPVVRAAGEGKQPTADDFRRRPALGGAAGRLAQSIAARVVGRNGVEVGSTHEGASRAQFGGESTIPITDTTRATLAKWLGISGTRAPKATTKKRPGDAHDYGRKLTFVFDPRRSSYTAQQAARPFIGFTDQTMAEVESEIADWLQADLR